MKQLWIIAAILLFGSSTMLASCNNDENEVKTGKHKPLKCKRPDYLKPGDKVALISPSYFTPMENVEKTADVLRGWGLEPVIGPNVGKTFMGKYAGTVEERLSDIRWALQDPDIKAIICNRGGYGSMHLINLLKYNEIAKNPKWIVGFSDITTYHGLWQNAGVMSIHGTMSSFLAKGGNDESSTLLRDMLMGKVPQYELPTHPSNIQGKAQGVLVGGNLCTLAPNAGSLADPTTHKDFILFIEEVEEPLRNIDRQFNILLLSGALSRCKGVILGEFTECGTDLTYPNAEAMLYEYLKNYNIPVICGFPGGHDDINLPLIMGASTTIDVRSNGATIQFNIDGEQQNVNTADITTLVTTSVSQRLQWAGKQV